MSILDDVPIGIWDPILAMFKAIVQMVVHREDPEKQREITREAEEKLKAHRDRLKWPDDPRTG